MPTVREYVNGRGYYIVGNVNGACVTFQVAPGGKRWLRRRDFRHGDVLSWGDFKLLSNHGFVSTGGSGVDSNFFSWDAPSITTQAAIARRRARRLGSVARALFEDALPAAGQRQLLLRLMGRTIRSAHRINPGSWSIAISEEGPEFVRISVGRLEVLACAPDGRTKLLVHEPLVNPKDLSDLRDERRIGKRREHKCRPRAITVWLPASELRSRLPELAMAHQHVVCAMAYFMEKNPYRRTHSPGALRYLRKHGVDVPNPLHGYGP